MANVVGIDVGGTHADGVVLAGEKVLVKKKLPVDRQNLSESLLPLLGSLISSLREPPCRIHLSTTLCTNTIVSGQMDPVGMLVQAGPGLNPHFLQCGDQTVFLDGAIDHRGGVAKPFSRAAVQRAASDFSRKGIESIGVVTKFSHRNHLHEQEIGDLLAGRFRSISLGHRISGLPNFPRRVYSTWLNAALMGRFQDFLAAIEKGMKDLGLGCPCAILKADGGTMPQAVAAGLPSESIHSGPSASVMGGLALCHCNLDAVLLDIGGTTTDIALLADGSPLLAPYGVTVLGRPTLIRALHTRSVGLGGDSVVCRDGDGFTIGPEKKGQPMALGGPAPTPSDALIVLGKMDFGDLSLAKEAMKKVDSAKDPATTAGGILQSFSAKIRREAEGLIDEVFSRPVYSVSALLKRKRLEPETLVAVGGPADAMKESLTKAFGLPCIVPEHFEVANAIGAARSRPTAQISLYADSSEGWLAIPEISHRQEIGSNYSMQEAKEDLARTITRLASGYGVEGQPPIDYLEEEEMNTVRGFRTTGKILTVKAQIRPGLAQVAGEEIL